MVGCDIKSLELSVATCCVTTFPLAACKSVWVFLPLNFPNKSQIRNMDKIVFKLILFAVALLFGTLVSGGNWLIGFVCAILILGVFEVDLAYRRGKKDGRAEYIEEGEKLKEQAEYIRRMEKKEEDENINKLKSAKTGQTITISKSYGVSGPNGEDDGKRFVRKEDAEEYLKRLNKK